jgi:peptidoglycan/xylan/chitin deacetylase (PgdA/CDA1 family)
MVLVFRSPGDGVRLVFATDRPHNREVAQHRPLILAYHAVDSAWTSKLAVSERSLVEQASYLHRRGYVGLTASEAERRRLEGTLPERSVVFTFDDGYASTARAADVLAAYGYPGTVFVVTRFADSGDPLTWFGVDGHEPERMRPLGWEALGRLQRAGWEVGSHTCTHPLLTSLDAERLRSELVDSRRRVIEQVGGCTTIAYPYGIADARVAAAAALAGYQAAFTLTGVELINEPLRRPRVGLFDDDRGLRLRLKLSRPSLAARRSGMARSLRQVRGPRSWVPPVTAGDGSP